MNAGSAGQASRYAAFISYSHADSRWARWLHRAIETYRVPTRLRAGASATLPPRLSPVFLDREELSSSAALADSVREALAGSAALLVVCSPAAAQSRWVNEEIRFYKSLGRADRIFCLIVAGDPAGAEDNCFPPALRFEVRAGEPTDTPAAEPLAADVRPGMDRRRDALLKLVAGMLGVSLDALRQREVARRQRRLVAVTIASTIASVVLAALAAAAFFARREAESQRSIAEQQALTARRTADFLKSLFRVSDPGEARGNSITAREILDRGVRQIDDELREEPLVRAELTTTLAEVYTSLGLYRSGADLLARARAVPGQNAGAIARQVTASAELEALRGNYAEAAALYRQGLDGMRSRSPEDDRQLARTLFGLGEVEAGRQQFPAAEVALREGLEATRRLPAGRDRDELLARGTEALAFNAFLAGDMDAAAPLYREALELRIRVSGQTHPKVAETLNSLGSIEYMRGNNPTAEEFFQRALPIDRKVLGERHPDIAGTLNNLARVSLEQRKFAQAVALLEESRGLMLAEKDETHDDMAFVFGNLGLARMGLGDLPAAEQELRKALTAARRHGHRLLGPVLTDLADLECRTGRYDDGLRRLAEAQPLIAERYADDDWRGALLDNVRGACLLGQGETRAAQPLLESSATVLLKRWPPGTLYGHDAVARMVRFYTLTKDASRAREYQSLTAPRSPRS